MTYLKIEVTRTGDDGVETPITDWERLTIRKGLDQKANSVNVVLTNPMTRRVPGNTSPSHKWVDDDGNLIWQRYDLVTVRARMTDENVAFSDTDVLIVGEAASFDCSLENNSTKIDVEAFDKSYVLLNQQVARAFPLSNKLNAPQMIQAIIQQASYNSAGLARFQITAELQTEETYIEQRDSANPGIQTRRLDNSEFPIIAMAKVYKPVYEWIQDLSTLQATNNIKGRDVIQDIDDLNNPVQNRRMRFYIDINNKARWFYPDDLVDYNIIISDASLRTQDVKKYKLSRSIFDVINFVIYNGGMDLYGVGTLNYFFDKNTRVKSLQSKYKAYNEIALILINNELQAGHLVANANGAFTHQGQRYNAISYGFETTWGVSTVGFNNDDYNNALRQAIDDACQIAAENFTFGRGNPRWKGTIVMSGRNYVAGEIIRITSRIHGFVNQLVRITDVTHTITKEAWDTTITLQEDEPPIGTVLN